MALDLQSEESLVKLDTRNTCKDFIHRFIKYVDHDTQYKHTGSYRSKGTSLQMLNQNTRILKNAYLKVPKFFKMLFYNTKI